MKPFKAAYLQRAEACVMLTEEVSEFVMVCGIQINVDGKWSYSLEERQSLGTSCEISIRPQAGTREKDDTPVMADVGHFHNGGGVSLEMGRNGD